MVRWRHAHEHLPARLARRAATTRLGAQTTGLETDRHRRRARGDARCRQPVAHARTRGWCGGIASPSRAWSHAPAHRRATGPDSRPARTRLQSVRLSWPDVDLQAGRRGDPTDLRRHVPSRPRQPAAPCPAPQRPAPARASDAARRDSHRCLVAGAVAGLGKKAVQEGRTIVWVDQSGFYLLPMAVRTWAPCRHTPVLRVPLTHDHLSAIGGLTPDGRLFVQTQDHAYRSPDVVRFLRGLLRKIRGKFLVILYGAPLHRAHP